MKIIVFGASGRTGHELVRQSLSQGHEVTAFVRNIDKLKVEDEQLRVIEGDVTNYTQVEHAVHGHDAVLSTLGAASPFTYDQSVVDGLGNVVKAMEATHVERFIYMSAINVAESRPNAGPVIRFLGVTLLRSETAGHEARETLIRQSPLQWTIVRPGKLSDGAHKATYRSGEAIKAKGPAAGISRADVADFMLRQLADTSFVRKAAIVMY